MARNILLKASKCDTICKINLNVVVKNKLRLDREGRSSIKETIHFIQRKALFFESQQVPQHLNKPFQ
ncbi:MAG: hypothetical protein IPN72_24540 [Saprospiraceae bacterium]|nr:hypothetical protein [Saprospiraceae bacterium]